MCSVCGCSHHHEHQNHSAQTRPHRHLSNELVRIEQDILSKNDRYASENRARLAAAGIFAVNLMSSPGSGKTTLLVKTVETLKRKLPVAVIAGDQQGSIDAERIRATGVPAIQINTGRGCHLDAHMIGHALEELMLEPGSILFIENIGNLVCPAAFDLGQSRMMTILSVTEGDDKPLKYPDVFAASEMLILSKIDLLPHVDFDVDRCFSHAQAINPSIAMIALSARTDAGMDEWLGYLIESARCANQCMKESLLHA
jgi:hydrogenase nickel incorporation protein HypB